MNVVMTKFYIVLTLLLSLSVLGSGCEEFEQDSCVSNSDCRSTLGLGSVCLDNGFCSANGLDQKAGTNVPISCSNGRVFPSAAVDRPEDFGDAIVIGVIARKGTSEPIEGIDLAIREFVIAEDDTGLNIVAITCEVDDTASDVNAQLQAATRYLADDVDAKVLMVSGLRDDLRTVIEAGSGFDLHDASSSPTIFTYSSPDSSIGGDILFSTVPTLDVYNLALADRVRASIEARGATPAQVYVLQNSSVFKSSAENAALVDALVEATKDSSAEILGGFFICDCRTNCSEANVRAEIDAAVNNAKNAGKELHLLLAAGCSRAAQTVGATLNTIANEAEFDEFTDTVASITLTGEAFSKENYAALTELSSYEDIMRGVSPAGNPGTDAYKTFQASYQSVFSNQTGLASSPLVAHAADATWLTILGSLAAYIENGDTTVGLTNAELRAGMRRFIDCSPEECADALSFPRTVASFDSLETTLSESGTKTFQVVGASGPLRFTTDNSTSVVDQGYFTQWKITSPPACLIPFGGEPTGASKEFYCSVLPSSPDEYVLFPKNE